MYISTNFSEGILQGTLSEFHQEFFYGTSSGILQEISQDILLLISPGNSLKFSSKDAIPREICLQRFGDSSIHFSRGFL